MKRGDKLPWDKGNDKEAKGGTFKKGLEEREAVISLSVSLPPLLKSFSIFPAFIKGDKMGIESSEGRRKKKKKSQSGGR